MKLLASSPTLEGLHALITSYFYGSEVLILAGEVHNRKGKIDGYKVEKKGQRYRFVSL